MLAFALAVASVAACSSDSDPVATLAVGPAPATRLELVGLVESVEIHAGFVRYELVDGRTWQADDGTYRLISVGGHGGKLLAVGTDDTGRFVATFSRQDGLPADCYVENAEGTDRGGTIELRGLRWAKAPGLTSDIPIPMLGQAYPPGTRFCLDASARLTSAIGP